MCEPPYHCKNACLFSTLDAQGKQKYQQGSWKARHENLSKNKRRTSVEEEEDYNFQTKREKFMEKEIALETERDPEVLEGLYSFFHQEIVFL